MTKRNTSIRINGQHYDALTGVMLDFETPDVPLSKHVAKSIDGVVGKSQLQHMARPMAAKAVTTVAFKTAPAVRRSTNHAKTHQAAPSTTLMRHAVKKPTAVSLKRQSNVQTHSHHLVKKPGQIAVVPKLSMHTLNKQRVARASQTALSPRVSRFAQEAKAVAVHEFEVAISAADHAMVVPQTFAPTTFPVAGKTTSDIFEQALLRATSHEEPAPSIRSKKGRRALQALRRRMVSFSAGAVAVLAIVGVFGYHQTTTSQFRTAASQAGFAATMPGYQPEGFSVADVNVAGGYLNLRYSDDNRSFAVTEKPTDWNSETLLQKITTSQSADGYATLQKSGRTVYVYGRNQAAWVNNGILYQVLGNGALTSDQFGQIAASM